VQESTRGVRVIGGSEPRRPGLRRATALELRGVGRRPRSPRTAAATWRAGPSL
jgi:hypothetical protein